MMRWIIVSSLRLRLAVATLAAILILFGLTQLRKMPVDALPEFSRPYVELQIDALGLSAQEVEALLTTPMEADMLNGTPWVKEIRSVSISGLASIVLFFEKDTDIMRARQMVQERLKEVFALPRVAKHFTMINPLSSASRVMAIGLTSEKLSLIEMSVLARWTIQPRLLGVPGVANVSIWGRRERQLQVQVDPEKLRDERITLMQIIKTAGNALWASPLSFLEASTPGTGGWIDTNNQRLGVRHLLPITAAKDLAKVPIEDAPSKRLGDVAKVVEDHQPLIGDAIVKDAPALMLVVEKLPWANTKEVTQEVEKALAALRPGLSGLEMDSSLFRPATFLDAAMVNLNRALLIGAILVVLAFVAFFFNWRTALVSTVAFVTSLIAAAGVLYLRGVTLNMVIIAGLLLALAAVIDDAVIDTENAIRRLREARQEGAKPISSIILSASLEMRGSIFYATLIMVLVVVPTLFLEGVSGAFFQPLATSYILALLASTLVALTVTPALTLILFRKAPLSEGASAFAEALRRLYRALFGWATRNPRLAFAAGCAALVLGLLSLPLLRQESLLPTFKETDLVVRWEGGPSASHPAMSRITTLASRELRAIPGVRNVSAQIGRAIVSDRRTNINSGEVWVSIDPNADYERTVAAVKEVVTGYPGLSPEVLTYLQARMREELSGTSEPLVVRVYGWDMDVLRQKAEEVNKMLGRIDGVFASRVQYPNEMPTLEVQVDVEKAQRHGLKPGDVRRAATTLVSGIEVGNLFDEQKVFEVMVYGTPEARHSLTGIEELLIDAPGHRHVRLKDVAEVRIRPSPTEIRRDAAARCLDVTANVRGRDLAAVAADIRQGLRQVSFPLEYHAELRGEYAERLAAQQRVLRFAIAAAVGILLVLQAFLRSWRLASVLFLTLPAGLVGGVWAAFLSGGLLSFGSIVALVALLGIAVRNAMVLTDRYRRLEQEGGKAPLAEVVQRSTEERAAAILMTAITTALAFLPLALFGDVAGLEIARPIAFTVLGGLVSTTLFALVGIPAIYLLFGREHEAEFEELALPAAPEQAMQQMAVKP